MSIKLHGVLVCLALFVLGITSGSQMDALKNKCSSSKKKLSPKLTFIVPKLNLQSCVLCGNGNTLSQSSMLCLVVSKFFSVMGMCVIWVSLCMFRTDV